ncbi:Aste57867_11462 [Aphanomyces stellatus]|uniref:Aste57867_11462 protein n=1 Tax=Aphanomyces stellatus TaxID=120398 RepID=A0A485KTD1_9STRA|nr:hypothetical protein As57867_011419 [Aphanomyces stellatus]VFT88323.1 Aste57867_11462 [Aphanomyces stellatus]
MQSNVIDEDIVERLLFGDDVFTSNVQATQVDDDGAFEESLPPLTELGDGKSAKRKRTRTTLKDEIVYLRAKQVDLQAQLDALQAQSMVAQPVLSVWEGRAKDQMQAAQKSRQENAALRTMLHDQLKTAQALERVLKKKPKLEISPDLLAEEWREWRLDTDPARRLHAMTSITDHLYAKMESEFIQCGIYDLLVGQSGISVRTHQNHLWFDYMQCSVVDVPFDRVAAQVWAVACFEVTMASDDVSAMTGEVLERMDSMVYNRTLTSVTMANGRVWRNEGRWLFRLYEERDRTVIIYRSILDDPLYPHAPDQFRDNLLGWSCRRRPYGTHTSI